MPFVNIRIVEGHSAARKDEIARRVAATISEVAEVPKEAVWVVFEEVAAEEDGRDGLLLDGGGSLVTLRGDGAQEGLDEGEIGKLHVVRHRITRGRAKRLHFRSRRRKRLAARRRKLASAFAGRKAEAVAWRSSPLKKRWPLFNRQRARRRAPSALF